MQDICNFLTPTSNNRDIQYHHFVYEAELDKHAQPFVHSHIYMHLAFKGEATLRTERSCYNLTPGTLFFTFPYQKHEIINKSDFTYLYITFDGNGALELLSNFGISADKPVFHSFGHLTDFWMTSIRRVNPTNILVLTESVLLHTLSYVDKFQQIEAALPAPQFDAVLQYVNSNFADPELSISKVAGIFCFSNKYFSALFVKNMGIKFTDHLTNIRIHHAVELLKEEQLPVNLLAAKCGYTDPFYFSKVFKKIIGVSPSLFRSNIAE